jgi:hypothetical protein
MFCGKLIGCLGFSHRGEYIGRRAMSGGGPRAHTMPQRGQGVAHAVGGVAALWAPSVSALDSVSCREKGTSAFVLSNSENISCVTFLKHKNSKKRELALWHLVNRLVPENA